MKVVLKDFLKEEVSRNLSVVGVRKMYNVLRFALTKNVKGDKGDNIVLLEAGNWERCILYITFS